jgi:predicted nucleotidyltransferase component of viral defense system
MISANTLRRIARIEDAPAGVAEKDYALTWLLYGIYNSKLSDKLVFMGGTAIRKVYFPGTWRFSEDLDFACPFEITPDGLKQGLNEALSKAAEESGMNYAMDSYHATEGHVTSRIQYTGPLGGRNNIKIDVHLREKLVSKPVQVTLISMYPDLGDFPLIAYTLDEILAEKMRSIMQRGKSRDYYDVWRLLKEHSFNKKRIQKMFIEKCTLNGIPCQPEIMFKPERLKEAETHWDAALKHLVKQLPVFKEVINELKEQLR